LEKKTATKGFSFTSRGNHEAERARSAVRNKFQRKKRIKMGRKLKRTNGRATFGGQNT